MSHAMVSLELICPHPNCYKPFTVAAERRGHVSTCPACRRALRVPKERTPVRVFPGSEIPDAVRVSPTTMAA
jgi:hypothetical protein